MRPILEPKSLRDFTNGVQTIEKAHKSYQEHKNSLLLKAIEFITDCLRYINNDGNASEKKTLEIRGRMIHSKMMHLSAEEQKLDLPVTFKAFCK